MSQKSGWRSSLLVESPVNVLPITGIMRAVHKTFGTILLLFAVGSTGCNRNRVSASSIEGQIGHAIEERCPKTSDCLIRLRDVTSFNWDKMFYFDYAVSPAEREKAVGFHLQT